jgi:hypothetical protein
MRKRHLSASNHASLVRKRDLCFSGYVLSVRKRQRNLSEYPIGYSITPPFPVGCRILMRKRHLCESSGHRSGLAPKSKRVAILGLRLEIAARGVCLQQKNSASVSISFVMASPTLIGPPRHRVACPARRWARRVSYPVVPWSARARTSTGTRTTAGGIGGITALRVKRLPSPKHTHSRLGLARLQ